MRHLKITLLVFLFIPFIGFGQDESKRTEKNSFEKMENDAPNQRDTIIRLDGGNELVISEVERVYPVDAYAQLLYDSNGRNIGTYKFYSDPEGKRGVFGNVILGTDSFQTAALTNAMISADNQKVIVYGNRIQQHVQGDLWMEIYSLNGDLIKEKTLEVRGDYVLSNCSDGGVVFAGWNEKGDEVKVGRIGPDGRQTWKATLPAGRPKSVSTSTSGQYVVYTGERFLEGERRHSVEEVFILDGMTGSIIKRFDSGFHHLTSVIGTKIIGDQYLIAFSPVEWKAFDLQKDYEVVAQGIYSGRLMNDVSVSIFPEQRLLMVATTTDLVKSTLVLDVFDYLSGEKSVSRYPIPSSQRDYRIVDVDALKRRFLSRENTFLIELKSSEK